MHTVKKGVWFKYCLCIGLRKFFSFPIQTVCQNELLSHARKHVQQSYYVLGLFLLWTSSPEEQLKMQPSCTQMISFTSNLLNNHSSRSLLQSSLEENRSNFLNSTALCSQHGQGHFEAALPLCESWVPLQTVPESTELLCVPATVGSAEWEQGTSPTEQQRHLWTT